MWKEIPFILSVENGYIIDNTDIKEDQTPEDRFLILNTSFVPVIGVVLVVSSDTQCMKTLRKDLHFEQDLRERR